jgi:hypothetical protein
MPGETAILGAGSKGNAIPLKNAIAPGCVHVQPAAPSQRRLLLRLGFLWCLPLLSHAVAAGQVGSVAASTFDWSADPAAARAAALLASIGKAHWVQEGAGTRLVYIFFDPNCPCALKSSRVGEKPGSILCRQNLKKWVNFRSAPTHPETRRSRVFFRLFLRRMPRLTGAECRGFVGWLAWQASPRWAC